MAVDGDFQVVGSTSNGARGTGSIGALEQSPDQAVIHHLVHGVQESAGARVGTIPLCDHSAS